MEKVFRALAAGMERPTYLSRPKKQVEGAAEAPMGGASPQPTLAPSQVRLNTVTCPLPPPPTYSLLLGVGREVPTEAYAGIRWVQNNAAWSIKVAFSLNTAIFIATTILLTLFALCP